MDDLSLSSFSILRPPYEKWPFLGQGRGLFSASPRLLITASSCPHTKTEPARV